jgi:hypothetical protein
MVYEIDENDENNTHSTETFEVHMHEERNDDRTLEDGELSNDVVEVEEILEEEKAMPSINQPKPDMDTCIKDVLLHAFRLEIIELYALTPTKELNNMLAHDIRGGSLVDRIRLRVIEQYKELCTFAQILEV